MGLNGKLVSVPQVPCNFPPIRSLGWFSLRTENPKGFFTLRTCAHWVIGGATAPFLPELHRGRTSAVRGRLRGIQIWLFSLGGEGKDPVSLMFITVGQGSVGEG